MAQDQLTHRFSIIAIGGSAGSLEVILRMLGRVNNLSLAVLVVLHRKSTADSMLAEVLAERSLMTVKEAEEKEKIQAGFVYLAPADYHLLVESDHTLSLDYSEKVNFSRPSIDVSFESVAGVYGSAAVGILLSGGNSDGVNGLRAIKEAGGMAVVQDPGTAEMAFMPESAVSQSVVDLVLKSGEFADFINGLK